MQFIKSSNHWARGFCASWRTSLRDPQDVFSHHYTMFKERIRVFPVISSTVFMVSLPLNGLECRHYGSEWLSAWEWCKYWNIFTQFIYLEISGFLECGQRVVSVVLLVFYGEMECWNHSIIHVVHFLRYHLFLPSQKNVKSQQVLYPIL